MKRNNLINFKFPGAMYLSYGQFGLVLEALGNALRKPVEVNKLHAGPFRGLVFIRRSNPSGSGKSYSGRCDQNTLARSFHRSGLGLGALRWRKPKQISWLECGNLDASAILNQS